MAKNTPDPDWWKSQIKPPTRREWNRFMRGQRQQFNPLISYWTRQSKKKASDDPIVKQIEALMGGEKSVEDISGGYDAALAKVKDLVAGTNFAAMGQGVSGAVGALGGALGVEGAGDIAQAAGRVSGIGDGQDVFSQAIMAGVGSEFGKAKTESLKARADRLMQLGLSKAEAEKAARAEAAEARRELASLRGQRRAASTVNPLEQAMQFMQFGEALRGYNSGGYGAGGNYGPPEVEEEDPKYPVTTADQIAAAGYAQTTGLNQLMGWQPRFAGTSRTAPGRRPGRGQYRGPRGSQR